MSKEGPILDLLGELKEQRDEAQSMNWTIFIIGIVIGALIVRSCSSKEIDSLSARIDGLVANNQSLVNERDSLSTTASGQADLISLQERTMEGQIARLISNATQEANLHSTITFHEATLTSFAPINTAVIGIVHIMQTLTPVIQTEVPTSTPIPTRAPTTTPTPTKTPTSTPTLTWEPSLVITATQVITSVFTPLTITSTPVLTPSISARVTRGVNFRSGPGTYYHQIEPPVLSTDTSTQRLK